MVKEVELKVEHQTSDSGFMLTCLFKSILLGRMSIFRWYERVRIQCQSLARLSREHQSEKEILSQRMSTAANFKSEMWIILKVAYVCSCSEKQRLVLENGADDRHQTQGQGQRGRVVSASDSGSGGRGFDSQPCHVVIALGKQFTQTFPSPPTCKMGTQLKAMSL